MIGSDTDTIATMAGALLGAVAVDEPPVEVMDSALIAAEAERMAELASGGRRQGHRYPDLLTWTAPKTQADALFSDEWAVLHVAGLGPIRRTFGDPMPAPQGAFQWQWAELAFGQTILIKRRDDLPIVHHPDPPGDNTEGSRPRRREAAEMPVAPDTRRPQRRRWGGDRSEPEGGSPRETAAGHERRARPLELARVIEFVEREQRNDASIGYAVRRVANEATPEQIAAFLAVLLEILRRSPPGGR